MKARYRYLLENSISVIFSAIEIYNKPDFRYRNEIFVVLTVNAWELLLKSKILKDNNGKLNSLYIKKADGTFALNRNKTKKTIDIFSAINLNKLDTNLKRNLKEFIRIRDNAIHFYNKEKLNYLIFTLGVANLKNYQKLVKKWYNKDLSEYNFYILPLSYAYSFKAYSKSELKKEPKTIKNLINSIQYHQENQTKSEYEFICETEVNLKPAKKVTENTDTKISIKNTNKNSLFYADKRLTGRYPLTYTELLNEIKKTIPTASPQDLKKLIKENKIKGNDKYSAYQFMSKEKEKNYTKTGIVPANTKVMYNHDCLKYLKSLFNDI